LLFKSGFWGGALTDNGTWKLDLTASALRLDDRAPVPYLSVIGIDTQPGQIWDTLKVTFKDGASFSIDVVHDDRVKIVSALLKHVSRSVQEAAPDAAAACLRATRQFAEVASAPRYLGNHELASWAARQGVSQLREAVSHPFFDPAATSGANQQEAAAAVTLIANLDAAAKRRNADFVRAELEAFKTYFDSVESRPLTTEQRVAAVTMEDRNLVVAAAGSGKTSVIVGKAGYAIQRGYAAPGEILVLAFNKDAVKEIGERINGRLEPLLGGQSITVSTFHALGQRILARAEGVKPSISNEVAAGDASQAALFKRIVDSLVASDPAFASDWLLFRSVCLRPARDPAEFATRDEWDRYIQMTAQRAGGEAGYLTMRGEPVKSQGELAIANWLFLQGIEYQYEGKYKHLTATETHRQYKPDFYLPDIDCYLEHFAVGADGHAVRAFGPEYAEGMDWKRKMHRDKATTLIETTFHQFVSGQLFTHLEAELRRLGQPFRPRPSSEVNEALRISQQAEYDRMLSTLLPSFVKHAKSNQATLADMQDRARQSHNPFRALLFARLADIFVKAYDQHLKDAGEIDFEDMIVRATQHVAGGRAPHPYKLILVDEFQDISSARALLVNAMLAAAPGCKLCAVGDDWQAIYRFAGSDVSIFRNFERLFGRTEVLLLSETFRSNQGIADVATRFVAQPTDPYVKRIRAADKTRDGVVQAWLYDQAPEAIPQLHKALQSFAEDAKAAGSRRTAFVLCRYRFLMDHVPEFPDLRPHLSVEARTIHSSKGLQADYVALIGLTEGGAYCFPSETADDPLLQLVMPEPEADRFAEERRLMYVALTRARHKVALVGRQYRSSRFLTEILENTAMEPMFKVAGQPVSGGSSEMAAKGRCPQCGKGMLRLMKGQYGPFYGCSSYPRCDHTQRADQSPQAQDAGRRRRQFSERQANVRARHESKR